MPRETIGATWSKVHSILIRSSGTGLIIGTGAALAKSGPGSIFISYSITGFVVYMVMCALGEMAAWLPLESGFTGVGNSLKRR